METEAKSKRVKIIMMILNGRVFDNTVVIINPPLFRKRDCRHMSIICEAPRPQGGASRRGSFVHTVPLDPAYKAGLAGHVSVKGRSEV
jgi:hypothetical protein